ncbi:hypothetical protein BDN72DRAFT_737394, partial [Pluteus cervinus]
DALLRNVSPRTVIRLSGVNRASNKMVKDYMDRSFSLVDLLEPFFLPDEVAGLRRMQRDLGVIISGSRALQFFDRCSDSRSGLDLYVPSSNSASLETWLKKQGYRLHGAVSVVMGSSDDLDAAIVGTVTFRRSKNGLPIHVVSTRYSVIEAVLGFSLSCVMNIITFKEAISFYPVPTLETREALVNTRSFAQTRVQFLEEYQRQGWTIVDERNVVQPPAHADTPHLYSFCDVRCVGDKRCWTIPL